MPISLGELATRFGCDLIGDPDAVIVEVASLSNAGPHSLSFFSNSKLIKQLSSTKAAAVVLRAGDADAAPCAALLSADPYETYVRMVSAIHPPPPLVPGIDAAAVVHETAIVSSSAEIAPLAVIAENSVIGEHVYVGSGTVVGPDCRIGDHTRLNANVTLPRKVVIGERCIIHSGAVIGADGFGNTMTSEGWLKVPQLGGVSIGSDVEIGANTAIDCGAINDTVIEDGVRIDNLCHIAHNVRIGAHSAIAGMAGIAGSTTIGKRCLFAGQVGCVGHISICDDVMVSGKGMITKDITVPGAYANGFPAEPVRDWNRAVARFRRLGILFDRVAKLEKDRN
jgi:UDP-3-O-[3-hydroxymyristoyl] glucosamine N-acyltransferase